MSLYNDQLNPTQIQRNIGQIQQDEAKDGEGEKI